MAEQKAMEKTCLEQFVDFEYGLEDYISLLIY
jgi:hypothetical protein